MIKSKLQKEEEAKYKADRNRDGAEEGKAKDKAT